MPLYDYRCLANGRVIEVRHPMRESITLWGEFCRRAEIDAGDTPEQSQVERLITDLVAFVKPSHLDGGGCYGVPGCGPGH